MKKDLCIAGVFGGKNQEFQKAHYFFRKCLFNPVSIVKQPRDINLIPMFPI
jgi:hypothetical protein